MRSVWLGLALSGLAATSLVAQSLSGRVLGPTGPLMDALVIMHDTTGERARTQTTASGSFAFPLEPSEAPVFLLVRAIGFAPQSFRLPQYQEHPVTVTMVPYALPLPELAVRAVKTRCPNRPSLAAGQLWESARTKYALPGPSQGIQFFGRRSEETLSQEQVGRFDESRLQPGQMGRAGTIRAPAADAIDHSIYARRLDGPVDVLLSVAKGDDIYAQWWYPALESWQVDHWLQPSFRDNHILSLESAADGQLDIVFCPKDRKKPSVAGVLTLAKDSTLASAVWAFTTGKPDENAGGRVDFLPVTSGRLALLQPSVGVFWRQLVGWQRYIQRAISLTRMEVSPDQRIPGQVSRLTDG